MIISPRAKEVIDVLWIENNDGRIIETDEVFLYHRTGVGEPYRKTLYWKRDEDAATPESARNASMLEGNRFANGLSGK